MLATMIPLVLQAEERKTSRIPANLPTLGRLGDYQPAADLQQGGGAFSRDGRGSKAPGYDKVEGAAGIGVPQFLSSAFEDDRSVFDCHRFERLAQERAAAGRSVEEDRSAFRPSLDQDETGYSAAGSKVAEAPTKVGVNLRERLGVVYM